MTCCVQSRVTFFLRAVQESSNGSVADVRDSCLPPHGPGRAVSRTFPNIRAWEVQLCRFSGGSNYTLWYQQAPMALINGSVAFKAVVSLGVPSAIGTLGAVVTLDGSASFDRDTAGGLEYEWTLQDPGLALHGDAPPLCPGSSLQAPLVHLCGLGPGRYSARLRVRDVDGGQGSADATVVINSPPVAALRIPPPVGTSAISLIANGSYDAEANLTDLRFEWLHVVVPLGEGLHAPFVEAFAPVGRGSGATVTATDSAGVFSAKVRSAGTHWFRMVVVDPAGAQDTAQASVQVAVTVFTGPDVVVAASQWVVVTGVASFAGTSVQDARCGVVFSLFLLHPSFEWTNHHVTLPALQRILPSHGTTPPPTTTTKSLDTPSFCCPPPLPSPDVLH
jgi:hypothetical protein